MTVETTTPSGEQPATTEPAEGTAVVEPTTPRTVEEVEREYQARISGKDKAHAAETQALRERLTAFEKAEEEKRRAEDTARQASMTAEQRMQDQVNALQRQLEEKDRNYTVELRKTRFPNVSAELDDNVLAVADEGKLASLEAKLTAGLGGNVPPSLIDKNSVARTGNGTTSPQEQTIPELLAQLEREAPAFKAEMEAMGVGMRRDT